ncbi:8447_t:CDS:2, partial [Funneliformis geosporum]
MSLQVLYSILNHPNQLQNSMRMADYLISESDRLLNEILNSLKINQNKLRKLFKGFIDRHSKRLWRLYLTRAEVCFKAEDLTLETSYLLRVIINNVSGYVVKLQLRRYKTYCMGITYDYDFPELFCQAIRIRWNTANSVARIGLAEEVINHFTLHGLIKEIQVKIKNKFGIECLKGSGLITQIASRAYEDIFTIMLVTCHSVELHNSNWVVMDPTINDDMMEMYADKKARAGVLEPKGIVEIKFKKPQLLTTIENIP